MSSTLSAIYRAVTLILRGVVFAVSWLVPRNERLWVFMTGEGERFADNSKYLYLHCEQKDAVRNVWIAASQDVVKELRAEGYEAYTTTSLRGKLCMLRAGVFFETHGPIAPEYTGRAQIVHLTHGNYLKTMLDDHVRDWPWIVDLAVGLFFERNRQYVVTSDGPPAENMASMRGAPRDRMLVTGFPRNDALFGKIDGERIGLNTDALERVKSAAERGSVLVYAPTHRTAYDEQNGIPLGDLDLGFEQVDEALIEQDATLFVSPHPATTIAQDFDELDRIERLDTGGDLYPFLRNCDVLITDYSGIFYDFLLLDRPMVFYAPDLDEYLADRALYFEYTDHVPGEIATDKRAFLSAIETVLSDGDAHGSKREEVTVQFYANVDAAASERVYSAVHSRP